MSVYAAEEEAEPKAAKAAGSKQADIIYGDDYL